MNIRKLIASAAIATLVGGGLALAGTTAASAHTPEVTATCSTIDIKLTNYQTKGASGSPTIVVTNPDYKPEVAAVEAVYGPAPIVTPATDAETATQYEWKSWNWDTFTFDYQWAFEKPGQWWYTTGGTKLVVVKEATPDIYGEQPLITPAVAYQAAVGTPTIEVANPDYVAGNAAPNTVKATVDGVVVLDTTFGASYTNSLAIDGSKAHNYKVDVVGYTGVGTKSFSGKTTACPPTNVTLPTLTVTPPTCDTDGTLPFLGNPAAQNPNGYEFPGQGFRVYISPAFSGPGTYTATLQKIGAGFDPAFPYGTKVTGETTQTLVVEGATGFQGTDPEAPCYVALPPTETTFGEWTTPVIDCDTEVGAELSISREVTVVTYSLNTETGEVTSTSETNTERDVHVVTQDEVDALDCPVPPVTPEEPETPVVVDEPLGQGGDEGLNETVVVADKLAVTGTDAERTAYLLGGGALALLLGATLIALTVVRRRQNALATAQQGDAE